MMSLWDALRMNMMISYQELVRTFLRHAGHLNLAIGRYYNIAGTVLVRLMCFKLNINHLNH
ncbi:Uncharacterised protein [Klebsiella pneumoniae]|nr:Uncharacterised protein [Klebsiella pneumoniae]